MNKSIRSKVVRESLLDYNTLANSLKENTDSAVKALLSETVRDTYAKLLSEDDDKDYEEGEVEDTNSDATNDAESVDTATDGVEDTDAGMENLNSDSEGGEELEGEVDDAAVEGGDDDSSVEGEISDEEGIEDGDNGEEWAEFDKYKVSDDEYDFTNAEDEEIVKVYKLMKNDDQILVNKDEDGKVSIQDNETGAEYLLDLGGNNTAKGGVIADEEGADDFGAEDDFEENNFENDMNESTEKLFELVLEYDSNVGYTDNYQKKDVMTNPGMSEPGKNVNDWDAGVPKGTSKPWSGKKDKANKPFDGEKGKQVEEGVEDGVEDQIEEANLSQSRWNDTHAAHNRVPAANQDSHRRMGMQKTSKGAKYRPTGGDGETATNENFTKRANAALRENKELKGALTSLMEELKKVSVTNHNLAQIIKLISENTTSQDEKKEIINRFKNEGKTIDASKNLYETISRELKKSNKMNITEDKSLTVEGSKKINETPIYQSKDLMESLDLMHRMMK